MKQYWDISASLRLYWIIIEINYKKILKNIAMKLRVTEITSQLKIYYNYYLVKTKSLCYRAIKNSTSFSPVTR